MKGILFKAGLNLEYQVDFCISGQQSFDLVKKMYKEGMKYKLILTDFNMPGLNGIEATKLIRNFLTNEMKLERKDQPVIIGVTGHAHEDFKLEGIKAGMDKVEIKPCYFNVIKEIISDL